MTPNTVAESPSAMERLGWLRESASRLFAALGRRPELEPWRFRDEWRWPVLIAVGLWLFYAWCSPRTVALEDDGLFILASYFNGNAHPPGYPVFTLIGHLFSQLPFGSVAWRVHLVSALFGGLTCAVIWCIVRSLVPSRPIAAAAALAYGFSEVFWSQAIIAEVYTLNTFITFLLVLMLLRFSAARASSANDTTNAGVSWFGAGLLGFVYGIGLSNHWPLLVLFSPAYLLLGWPIIGSLLRRFPVLLLGLGIGLLPYLWLYLHAHIDLEVSFSGPIDDWVKFYKYVSRSTYSGADQELGTGWNDKVGFMKFQLSALQQQFTIAGSMFAFLGIVFSGRHMQTIVIMFIGAFCSSFLLIFLLDREYSLLGTYVYRVYPLPLYGVMALSCALGLNWLRNYSRQCSTNWLSQLINTGAVVAVVGLPLAVNSAQNYRANYAWAEEFAKAALDEVPAGGRLLLYADADALPIGYVNKILGYRDDIDIYSGSGLIFNKRAFNPWAVRDSEEKKKAVAQLIESSDKPTCFVGIENQFKKQFGIRWAGLTSCYDLESEGVYNGIENDSIERYAKLQKLRTNDNWTMMVADNLDGQMVYVLLAKLMRATAQEKQSLSELVDRARLGLKGKLAFVRNARSIEGGLTAKDALELLEDAGAQTSRAYTKNHLVDLYGLTAHLLEVDGQDALAEEKLFEAIRLKPSWRNELLPNFLTQLFRERRAAIVERIADLDPDLAVLNEIYTFYVENSDDPAFGLTMRREGMRIVLHRDGTLAVK